MSSISEGMGWWHEGILLCIKKHGKINYLLLSKMWGVSSVTAGGRVSRMRVAGLDTPPLTRLTKDEKAEMDALDVEYVKTRTPRVRGLFGTTYAHNSELGDPNLPVCENCKRKGRSGRNGEVVHAGYDDGEIFCFACGWSPGDEAYREGVIEIGASLAAIRCGEIFSWNEVMYVR